MKNILFIILALFWNKLISQTLNICPLPSLNKEQTIVFWDKAAKMKFNSPESDSLINVFDNDETLIKMHSDSIKHWLRAIVIYSNDKKFVKKFLADNDKDYNIKGRQKDGPKLIKLKCDELVMLSEVKSDLPNYKYYYEIYFTYQSEAEFHEEDE